MRRVREGRGGSCCLKLITCGEVGESRREKVAGVGKAFSKSKVICL